MHSANKEILKVSFLWAAGRRPFTKGGYAIFNGKFTIKRQYIFWAERLNKTIGKLAGSNQNNSAKKNLLQYVITNTKRL